jgi:hypothetical protein
MYLSGEFLHHVNPKKKKDWIFWDVNWKQNTKTLKFFSTNLKKKNTDPN